MAKSIDITHTKTPHPPIIKSRINDTRTRADQPLRSFSYRLKNANRFAEQKIDASPNVDYRRTINQRKYITKLEHRIKDLEDQQHQLEDLNRAKSDFVSLASHQLRTPATGVKQYLGILLEGMAGVLDPSQKKFIENAYASNERQLKIIDDLLTTASFDAGTVKLHFNEFDMRKLLKDIIDEQHGTFKKRSQKVIFSVSNSQIPIRADRDNLRMALENIIENAGKYSGKGKRVVINAKQEKNQVIVCVSDEGVGISKENIAKVFDKFTRVINPLSASVGGSGLGLYWANNIVKLHGGHISITSKPRKGSTFRINLPVSPSY